MSLSRKKLAWVGRLSDSLLNGDSNLLVDLRKHLEDTFEFKFYTNREDYNFSPNTNSIISLVPEVLDYNPDIILYNISNYKDCYLFYRMFKILPGVVILHDISILKLLVDKHKYTLDKQLINNELLENNKDLDKVNRLDIGQEFILGRSVEIYNQILPCLDEILELANSIIVLENKHNNYLIDCYPKLNKDKIFTLSRTIQKFPVTEKGDNAHFSQCRFIYFESPFSSLFSEFEDQIYSCEGVYSYRTLKFPLLYQYTYENEFHKLIKINNLDIDERILNSNSTLIISGSSEFNSLKPFILLFALNGSIIVSDHDIFSEDISERFLYETYSKNYGIDQILKVVELLESQNRTKYTLTYDSNSISSLKELLFKNTDHFTLQKQILINNYLDMITQQKNSQENSLIKDDLDIELSKIYQRTISENLDIFKLNN